MRLCGMSHSHTHTLTHSHTHTLTHSHTHNTLTHSHTHNTLTHAHTLCVGSNTYDDATFLKCIGDQTPEATKLMKREGSPPTPQPSTRTREREGGRKGGREGGGERERGRQRQREPERRVRLNPPPRATVLTRVSVVKRSRSCDGKRGGG